jgi:hypothetical protein
MTIRAFLRLYGLPKGMVGTHSLATNAAAAPWRDAKNPIFQEEML